MLLYFVKKRNHPNAKKFKRLIDVDHEGEKLSYGEYLARYYFVHRLANNYDNEIDIKNKKND